MRVIYALPLLVPAVLGLAACDNSPPPATQVVVQPPPTTIVPSAPTPPPPAMSELVPPPPVSATPTVWQPGPLALHGGFREPVELASGPIRRRPARGHRLGSRSVAATANRLGLA